MVKIVFMGSPEFAVPVLNGLAAQYGIAGVITQPDKPAGRGRTITSPPVKVLAETLGLPVVQPARLREPEVFAQLSLWSPDLIVVAAYGQILRQNVLDLPRYGCLNVHASLLPRWRGASPVQAALLHGDAETGVTIMQMEAGLDTGPMLAQRSTPIQARDTAETLTARLAEIGAGLLLEMLPQYLAGECRAIAQDETQATYAGMIQKEEGQLDFKRPGAELERKVRAFSPWPGAFLSWEGGLLKVHRAHFEEDMKALPGKRTRIGKLPAVGAADGWLVLEEVQPSGKKPMPGSVFLNGARQWMD